MNFKERTIFQKLNSTFFSRFDFRQSPPVNFRGVKVGQDEVKLSLPNPSQNPLLSKLRKNQVTNVDGRIGFFFIDLKKRPSITRM